MTCPKLFSPKISRYHRRLPAFGPFLVTLRRGYWPPTPSDKHRKWQAPPPPPTNSSTSFSFLLSVAGPLHYCLSATQLPPCSSTNESARQPTLQWQLLVPSLPCILLAAHLHGDTTAYRRQRGCKAEDVIDNNNTMPEP